MDIKRVALNRLQNIGRHILPGTKTTKKPLNVVVTGAAGNIGYALVFMMCQGRMFGAEQPINLTMLEIPPLEQNLLGVAMEVKDCAPPLITGLQTSVKPDEAFKGCEVALLVGGKPRGPGMKRKDLLEANAGVFKNMATSLNKYADKNCKVCVVANPANTNALILAEFCKNIPRENFTALTRLDQNRAAIQIADRVNCNVNKIKNVIIWGNHSATQFPDATHGIVADFPRDHFSTSLAVELQHDTAWLQKEFLTCVQERGAAIIKQTKKSSAASAANAICDHMHDWIVGTLPGECVSMGVMSDGSYGVPKDICFSFPVTCINGKWEIVQGLKWNDFAKEKIRVTTEELQSERKTAIDYCATLDK